MAASHSARFEITADEIPELVKAIDEAYKGNDNYRRIVAVDFSIMEASTWFLTVYAPSVRSFLSFMADIHMSLPEKSEIVPQVKKVKGPEYYEPLVATNTADHQDEQPTPYVAPEPVSDEDFPVEEDWDEGLPEEEADGPLKPEGETKKQVVLKKPKSFQKVSSGVSVEEDDDEE